MLQTCSLVFVFLLSVPAAFAIDSLFIQLKMPKPGDHTLTILSPTLLELTLVDRKPPDPAPIESWNWVDGSGNFVPPDLSSLRVVVNGQTNTVAGVGFKRRPFFAPLEGRDLRVASHLYLRLNSSIPAAASVQVIQNGTLWPSEMQFAAVADTLRYNPAIHVNQEGYLPAYPKKAAVGYYVGNLGEMPIATNTFLIVQAQNGTTMHQGTLTLRPDFGFTYSQNPYQNVYEADFSSFTTPGAYRLVVPGLGASLPFRIDDGVGMTFARAYALGVFHQRSGYHVALPFTRFAHGADHTAPVQVPFEWSPTYNFTWVTISNYAVTVNAENPPQVAPRLTSPAAQLYPYVNLGPVDVAGGHFEAGNYSKIPWNSAQLIHVLMFAVDALPGVAALDNLGLPESGDGISDLLQEAKWEADALAKMQDSDGGFYYMIHPVNREYEMDVLPEYGDPQVAWPKNTATTAASVAALAQCASSPAFKAAYPQTASIYWSKALLGWQFLTNAIAAHGSDGAYQRIMHFDDQFTDKDDRAWAACEMFLATGNPQFQATLQSLFPDPTDPGTTRWGWKRMFASYGNAIRGYSTAVRSGRLNAGQLDPQYLAKCLNAVTNCGRDNLLWSQQNAYGTSFPEPNKRFRTASWYYSTEQAFDLLVAHAASPDPAYVDAILRNINYEAGCNPINVTHVTGLGWKRQRQLVDLYSFVDHRVLPKTGIPIGNIEEGFVYTWYYALEPVALTFPPDSAPTEPYAFYDRWGDAWNVSGEASTANTVRSLAVTAWLAAQTSLAAQPWRSTNATISIPPGTRPLGQPLTVNLQVADPNLNGTRIVWEARDQEPSFGSTSYTFTPNVNGGFHWIEAEVQWPDGRRAFASNAVFVSTSAVASPQLTAPRREATGGFSFMLSGAPQAAYVIQASTNMLTWQDISTPTLPADGALRIVDPQAASLSRRYYRALKASP